MRHIRLCLRVKNSPHLRTALVALLLVGCAKKAEDSGTPEDAAPPSWAQVRNDVLVPSCGFGSCHGSGVADLHIDEDMTSDALIGVTSTVLDDQILVIPSDADGSYLMAKLLGSDGIDGEVMPPSGALSDERIDIVRSWINAGALD